MSGAVHAPQANGVPLFDAFWFDGSSPVAHPVSLAILGQQIVVRGAGGALLARERLDRIRMSDPGRHAPRLLTMPGGATLEVTDGRGFTRAAGRYGRPRGWVARLERRPAAAVAGVALLLALAVFIWMVGIPFAAKIVAHALPPALEARVGDELMRALDGSQFQPSKLDADRRAAIEARFAAAAHRAAPAVQYKLEFRRAPGPGGVNAFAIPGGRIIVLDGLVNMASDDELLGVLGHELGHVAGRHGMRSVMQGLGIGVLAGALWGDFAGAASNVPVALGVLRFSRNLEREADDFACEFMRTNGQTVDPLIDFLERIEAGQGERRGFSLPEFTSTHPDTPGRIALLRACPR